MRVREGVMADEFQEGGRGRGRYGREAAPALSAQKLFEKEPPYSPEAEMSLLGSMILDPVVIVDVLGILKGKEDFYKEAHQHIYQALVDVYDQHNTGDLVQIVDMLRHRRVLEQVGGSPYLVELANAGNQPIDVGGYVLRSSNELNAPYTFSPQALAPGQFLVVDGATLGYTPTDGDRLFLQLPSDGSVIDAEKVTLSVRGRAAGTTASIFRRRGARPSASRWPARSNSPESSVDTET